MTNPAVPLWDTNKTNTLGSITSGHSTDGYALDEVPTSTEMNLWMYLVGQWINILQSTMQMSLLAGSKDSPDPQFESEQGASLSTSWVYALTVGGANLVQGSANNKIKITPGVLFQQVGSTLLSHTFDGTDQVTIANGDPTNPRVDLIQLQITSSAAYALTVKQGTPAAAPAYPTPDAGTVPIGAVVVPATYAAGGTFIFSEYDAGTSFGATHPAIHDLRLPFKITPYRVWPKDFLYNPAVFGLNNSSSEWTGALSAGGLYVPAPRVKGRLIALEIDSQNGSGVTATLEQQVGSRAFSGSPGTLVTIGSLINAGAGMQNQFGAASVIEVGPVTGGGGGIGPTVTGNGTHGPPVWCNGMRSPKEARSIAGGNTAMTGLYAHIVATSLELGAFTFYIAEGI